MREAELAYVIRDRYPVTAGHLLIIPKRHEPSWFALSQGLRPLSPVQRERTFPREFSTHASRKLYPTPFFLHQAALVAAVDVIPPKANSTVSFGQVHGPFGSLLWCVQSIPQWGTILMVFIETSIFTRQIAELTTDGSYRELQAWLMASPDAGRLIRGGGGCRKVRWNSPRSGKRGSIRVIYYWMSREDRILMLLAYAKSSLDDLTPEQVRTLGKLAKQELGEFGNARKTV